MKQSLLIATFAALFSQAVQATPPDFTYQGFLQDASNPANGAYDFRFTLQYIDGMLVTQTVGTPQLKDDVAVSQGVFSVPLNFGATLTNLNYLLKIEVRPGASTGSYTTLSPDTAIKAAPQAQFADNAGFAATIADGSVSSASITDGNVQTADLSANAVTGAKVLPTEVQLRVSTSCAAGSSIRAIDAAGGVNCEIDDSGSTITAVNAGTGLTGGGSTGALTLAIADAGVGVAQINTSQVQSRVNGSCTAGNSIRAIATDGTVTCEADDNGGGTVTSVDTGTGLTGGPITGTGTIAIANGGVTSTLIADGTISATDINTASVQSRVTGTCAAGSSISSIATNGAVTCETDDSGSGTVTSIAAGAGLTGGTITSTGTIAIATGGVTSTLIADGSINSIDVNTASVQARVTGTCAAGTSISSIASNGTVTCETDDAGISSTTAIVSALPAMGTRLSSVPGASVGDLAAAIGIDGLPLIAHYEPNNGDLVIVHCDVPDCSSITRTVADSAGNVGLKPRVSIANFGANAFPLVTYYDATNTVIKALRCNNVACTSSNSAALTATLGAGQVHESSRNESGNLMVAYYDTASSDLRALTCTNYNSCNAPFDIYTSADNVGQNLVMGVNGFRYFAFRNSTNNHLLLRVCSELLISAGSCFGLLTLDNSGTLEDVHSLVVGDDGLPLVMYRKGGSEYVVSCTSISCATATTPTSIGPAGTSGALSVGSDGFPLYALYGTSTTTGSRRGRCATPSCTNAYATLSFSAFSSVEARPAIVRTDRDLPIEISRRGDELAITICDNRSCGSGAR